MKWFKTVFLPSFETCKGKRISEKQYNLFIKYLYDRYLYKESNSGNAYILEYHIDDLIIITQQSHVQCAVQKEFIWMNQLTKQCFR